MADALIFDLDGTLWDSRSAVAIARNAVVDSLNLSIPKFTIDDISRTMGMPVNKVYELVFPGLAPELFPIVRQQLDHGIWTAVRAGEAQLYPQVREGLAQLATKKSIYIVSNCSENYLENFLDWSGLRGLFQDYESFGRTGSPKSENIKSVVQRNNLQYPVYIGDTTSDQEAALAANVSYIHASYGFGQPFQDCRKVSHFSEILSIFLSS